jgi:hypothetical protein
VNFEHNYKMRKIGSAILFSAFLGLIASVSAERLRDWYETGQLAMHRNMPIGPDFVTYASDPAGFLIEFGLNAFLVVAGTLGLLAACRDIILEIKRARITWLI